MGESSQVFLGKALAISAGVALMALGSAAVYLWNKRRIYKSFSSDDAIDASRSDDNDVVSAIETSSSSYNDKDTASVEADCSALANACRIKGNKHFKSGQLEEAQKCYEESLQHYPADHADVALSYSNLAAVHLSMKNYAASLEACNKSLDVNPKFVKVLDRRSRVLELQDRKEEALVDALAAVVLDGQQNTALLNHVEELLRSMSEFKAKKQCEERKHTLPNKWIIQQFVANFPREWLQVQRLAHDPSCALAAVYEHLLNGDYSSAFTDLSSMAGEILQNSSNLDIQDQAQVFNWMGSLQLLSGDFSSAKLSFEKCLELDSKLTSPHLKMALLAMEQGVFSEMTGYLEKAMKLDETDPAVFYHRGEILALSNNMQAAVADFTRAIQLDASFVSAYVRQARAMQALGNVDDAKDFLQRSIRLFPQDAELHHTMGECLAMESQYQQALDELQFAIDLAPENPQLALTSAVIMHISNGADDDLGAKLHHIVEQHPDFAMGHVQLAAFLLRRKQFDDAINHYQLAAEHAKSYQDLVTIHSHCIISQCQMQVTVRYPELGDIIQYVHCM